MNIDNLRISAKIMLIVALLGAVAVGVLGFAIDQMIGGDAAFDDLVDRVDKNAIVVAGAAREATAFLASSYQLANETTDAGNIVIAADLKSEQAAYESEMAEAARALPEKSDLSAPLIAAMAQAFQVCGAVNAYSATQTSAAGVVASNARLKAECVPSIASALKLQSGFVADVAGYASRTAAGLSGRAQRSILLMAGLVAIGLAMSVAAAMWIGIGNLSAPIKRLKSVMEALAGQCLTTEVPGTSRHDELGDMARAVQMFKAGLIEAERLRADRAALQQHAAAERRDAMMTLASRFEAGVGGIVNNVAAQSTELEATARMLAASSEETSRQSATVAAASDQATRNVGTVASATEQLSASVQEILQQINSSNRMIQEAASETTGANRQMQGLSDSVRKISEVVSLINSIASQTNLLALNATIEAARAGDAGKGFAVVASEVKTLATQTAKATEVISSQIAGIQDVTQVSVKSIGQINVRIEQVAQTATAIAAAVEQQGAATREIARNVAEAAQGTGEVSANIGGVSESVQASGAASGRVLVSAADLSRNGEVLKAQVKAFLEEVRAA